MITLSVMSCPSKAVVILLKEKSSGVVKSSISIAYQVCSILCSLSVMRRVCQPGHQDIAGKGLVPQRDERNLTRLSGVKQPQRVDSPLNRFHQVNRALAKFFNEVLFLADTYTMFARAFYPITHTQVSTTVPEHNSNTHMSRPSR